jgi:hypothetical protein
MKRLMLAGSLLMAAMAVGFADDLCCHWVVGNHATGRCDIVSTNPVVGGEVWFGDRPYKSLEDAKLARSTVPGCPKDDPSGK